MVIIRVDIRNGTEMYWTGTRFSRRLQSAYRFACSSTADPILRGILSRSKALYFGYRIERL